MKSFCLVFLLIFSSPIFSASKLDGVKKLVQSCLLEHQVFLCSDEIADELRHVGMDARGDFVYYLKDQIKNHESERVIVNLFEKLQDLVVVYEELDGCSVWSCRDLKIFVGDVSTRYVKMSPIDSALYIKLYKAQSVQSSRYSLLLTLSEKSNSAVSLKEMDEMVRFAEFAKDHSRFLKDEYYLYQSGVALVKKMTLAALKLRPGHEGVYSLVFDNPEVSKKLRIDSVVIMESNDRDALVVNFVARDSRVIKVAFKQSGLLGNTFFSNEDVYHNDNNSDMQSPFFKMELDRSNGKLNGYFTTAKYGKSSFSGIMLNSNLQVYRQPNLQGLEMSQLVGSFPVLVGNYEMTLTIGKRHDENSTYQASLVNSNALLTFSKVNLDSNRGVLSLVDSKNASKLTLGIIDYSNGPSFQGQFMSAPQAKIFDVKPR